jgi:hypothetical protein
MPALREFIARNYAADERGCWFFQNGPQRVYVTLAYAPLVVHYEGEQLVDHCGRPFSPRRRSRTTRARSGRGGKPLALLDDRDLERYASTRGSPAAPRRGRSRARFGFRSNPGV